MQKRPEDNLHPEGEFERPTPSRIGPAERRTPIRHDDNLRPEGEFERPEKPIYQPAKRPDQKRPADNLRPEGEFDIPERTKYQPAERPQQKRPEDNLRPEERPKQKRPEDNLRPEGEFERPEIVEVQPAELRKPIKHDDNLRPEGTMEIARRDDYKVIRGERVDVIRREDNLKMEGEYNIHNLKPEGEFERPTPSKIGPGERRTPIRHPDNLHPEGHFDRPQKPGYQPSERPTPKKPQDNLHPEGEFETPQKPKYQPGERPTPKKPQDNLRPEGEFETPVKPKYGPGERADIVRHQDNLKPEVVTTTRKATTATSGTQQISQVGQQMEQRVQKEIVTGENEIRQSTSQAHVHQSQKRVENVTNVVRQNNIIHSSSHTDISSKQSVENHAAHHKRNMVSSEEISNQILHRKGLHTSTEALHATSSSALDMRKSVCNLHDQGRTVVNTERHSLSSMHRSNQESNTANRRSQQFTYQAVERPQKVVRKDNLSVGGHFYGQSEARSYGEFTKQQNVQRIERVNRRSNISNITLGDSNVHIVTSYKKEYSPRNLGPCPAVLVDSPKGPFKHTRDTKSHKYYTPVESK
ncbi:hypothetical protein NQ317_015066 [Molorchus minor]|uniref:Uncharacterized protein n=1 Tax=Molorchus minor TaxID=1323400 RepID=A0ABQ9JQH0_9CUCU|nr:hypothetical protein NQ317_015066 [Molorchus minor]